MGKYDGMTVNERLFISGMDDQFEEAIKKRDVQKVKQILEKLELGSSNIKAVLIHFNLPII